MSETGEHPEHARQRPIALAGGEKGANHEEEKQTFRIVNVQKKGCRKDKEEPYGVPREGSGEIPGNEAAHQHGESQRGGGGNNEGAVKYVPHDESREMNEQWIEGIKDQQQAGVAGGGVAVAGDIEIVRTVPTVPEVQDVGKRAGPLIIENNVGPGAKA